MELTHGPLVIDRVGPGAAAAPTARRTWLRTRNLAAHRELGLLVGSPAMVGEPSGDCPFSPITSHQIASELRWPRLGENRSLWFSQAWWAKFALAVLGVRGGSTAYLRQTHRWPGLTENGPDSSREDNVCSRAWRSGCRRLVQPQDNALSLERFGRVLDVASLGESPCCGRVLCIRVLFVGVGQRGCGG